jgi:hypothetical protein
METTSRVICTSPLKSLKGIGSFRALGMIAAVMILAVMAGCGGKSKLTLMSGGKSDYVICVADTSNHQIMRAAMFMQSYLKKIGGAEIPVKIGLTEIPEKAIVINLDPGSSQVDGFSIVTVGRQLIITGGNNKGCIYGVVDLLEKQFGCRMYAPGFEVVPKLDVVRLPQLNVKDQPVNEHRNVFSRFSEDENYRDWQRCNVIGDIFADGYYVHTITTIVPWQEYSKTHPEYFALINGQRTGEQVCWSNPEVLKIAIKKLETDMALQPTKKLWSVSQFDTNTYCQCDACKKIIEEEGSPSGPIIRFVNEVAKKFPDKIISTLAYQYSRQAPKLTKPEPNVQIMLCTIELNRSQAIADDPRSVSFVKDLVDWGKIAKHIYLWDYTVNFSHHVTPFPNMHVLQPNIQFFVKNNVFSHFQQTNADVGHEFSELKAYLLARLLWNPEIKTDSIINDFMHGYFGAAAPFIRTYLDTLQGEILKTNEWLDIYDHPSAHENTFLSVANLNRYFGYFDQAMAAVKDQPEFLLHVRTYLLPVQYATMEIGKTHLCSDRGWYALNGKKYVVNEKLAKMIEDFHQTCLDAGVRTLHEWGPSPEEYYQTTKKLLNPDVVDHLAFGKPVVANPLPSTSYGGGDLSFLTNGLRGANDRKIHWLGWEGQDFSLDLDLGSIQNPESVEVNSYYFPNRWIFHPASVSCSVSADGKIYKPIGTITVTGDQKKEDPIRAFTFKPGKIPVQFVRLMVKGTRVNPKWHPSAGGASWVFLDEIVVL